MTAQPAHKHLTIGEEMAADVDAASRLADDINARFAEDRRSRIQVSPQLNLWASSLGQKCDRRVFLDVTAWQSKAPHDEYVQGLFDRGNDMEPLVERKLSALGFRIIQSQVRVFDDELKISMKTDGQIVEDQSGRPIIVEIKSTVNPRILGATSAEDLKRDKWGIRYLIQNHIYMRNHSIYAALLIPWDGVEWLPKPIVIPFDPEFAEQIVQRAKYLNECIESGTAPDYIQDSRECRICPHFGRSCNPPISFGKGAQILTDEELLEEINEWMSLKDAGKRYNQLDGGIKKRLKDSSDDPQDGIFIIGPYEIHRTVGSRKGYEVKPSKPQTIDVEKVA